MGGPGTIPLEYKADARLQMFLHGVVNILMHPPASFITAIEQALNHQGGSLTDVCCFIRNG